MSHTLTEVLRMHQKYCRLAHLCNTKSNEMAIDWAGGYGVSVEINLKNSSHSSPRETRGKYDSKPFIRSSLVQVSPSSSRGSRS